MEPGGWQWTVTGRGQQQKKETLVVMVGQNKLSLSGAVVWCCVPDNDTHNDPRGHEWEEGNATVRKTKYAEDWFSFLFFFFLRLVLLTPSWNQEQKESFLLHTTLSIAFLLRFPLVERYLYSPSVKNFVSIFWKNHPVILRPGPAVLSLLQLNFKSLTARIPRVYLRPYGWKRFVVF